MSKSRAVERGPAIGIVRLEGERPIVRTHG